MYSNGIFIYYVQNGSCTCKRFTSTSFVHLVLSGSAPNDVLICTSPKLLSMEKKIPNNHLGCIKSCKQRDKLPINWLAGFLNHQQFVLCPGAKLGFLPAGPARTPRALRTLALLFREAERARRVGWCHGTLLLLMSGEYTFHGPQNLHFERFLW